MNDTIRIENAADVLAAAAPLPEATIAQPATADAAPAAATPPPTTPDRAGEVWDKRYHVDPPTLNAEGRWKKGNWMRGNGGRKLLGKPLIGKVLGGGPRVKQTPEAAPAEPAAAQPPPSVSTPPPVEVLNGQPPVVDGVPSPESPMRPFADYATTAGGVVDGVLGLAELGISPAWEPTPQERTKLVNAVQRVWHENQWPILGATIELVLVVLGYVAKRRTDEPTMSLFRRLFRREPAPKPVDPHAPEEPTPVSAVVPLAVPTRRNSAWD